MAQRTCFNADNTKIECTHEFMSKINYTRKFEQDQTYRNNINTGVISRNIVLLYDSLIYCITRIFRVEEIFAIFANLDFARNFPPAK